MLKTCVCLSLFPLPSFLLSLSSSLFFFSCSLTSCRRLFSFHKRSLPFYTVDATIGNQALHSLSHDGYNIFPGLISYGKANNTFLNSLRNHVEAQVEFTLKFMEGTKFTVIDVSVKKDSLLVYALKFLRILAGRCGSVVVRERDSDTKGPGSTLGCDFLSFFIKHSRVKNFLSCHKNGSDRTYEREICCAALHPCGCTTS